MSPDDALAQLRLCGLQQVEATHADDFQDYVIEVRDANATDVQMECAARISLDSAYWLDVPEAARKTYFAHYNRLSRERNRESARARLAEQGLLDRLPDYVAGVTDDAAFALELEALCGDAAKGALKSGYGPHAISPAWTAAGDYSEFQASGEAGICLLTFAAAAGFDLYLIGNEKMVELE